MNSKDRLKNSQMQPSRNTARQLEVPEQNILISPVPHLLKNNFPPTEDEVQVIQETISLAKDEERRLNKLARSVPRYAHSSHDAIYRETQKLRQNVQEFIHEHERLLSHLLSLPSELLALIFTHCLPSLETTWSNQRPPWRDRPLDIYRLSQVCQRWRIIALATPQLWTILGSVSMVVLESSLTIPIGNRQQTLNPKNPHIHAEFLQEMLRRSKDQGLSLSLYSSPHIAHDTFQNPFVGLLATHASRIVTLSMISSPASVNTFCAVCDAARSGLGAVTFPRLQRLALELGGNLTDTEIRGFAHAPALKDVAVMGRHPFRLALPWSQLHAYSETATTRGHSIGNLNAVFSSAKNLGRLKVDNLQYDILPRSTDNTIGISEQASVPAKVTHLRLRLPLHNGHEQNMSAVLTHLHYPSIQTLWMESAFPDILGMLLAIVNVRYSHLSTPFSNLKTLYYRSLEFDASNFISLLRLYPNLEELDVELNCQSHFHTTFSGFISIYRSSIFTSHNLLPALKKFLIHTDFQRRLSFPTGTDQMFSLLKDATHILRDQLKQRPSLNPQLILQGNDKYFLSQARAYLNNWTTSFSAPIYKLIFLWLWCWDLHKEIPPLTLRCIPRRGSGPGGHTTCTFRFSAARVNAILADIEKHELKAAELRDLYNSGLHLTLHRLARFPADFFPGDATHKFRARARRILKRWEPFHRADLCSANTLTLWAVKGIRTLVFIPLNDPRRTGPDAMKLIYGLDDE